MPPTSRSRNPPAGSSANRSRMYNLGGHAHSSGSLLPRSTDVHAASTSAATSNPAAAAARGVEATDAPYLTNLESHFGRVTLTAPDNLLRKQAAKDKKAKVRQKKALNAQAAALALAGSTQNASTSNVSRTAMASSSNLLDSNRRYQTTLDDAPVSTGLLLSAPEQHVVMRRAYTGNQTPTLTSTPHLQSSGPLTTQTVTATRTRRRRPSAAREDSYRPASRASGTSRPESALSFNHAEPLQHVPPTSDQAQQTSAETPQRLRTESAPATQTGSHNAFATLPNHLGSDSTAQAADAPPQTSIHRQNVWNDITEADPDDLPPPFPEGAPRPPTPPHPPAHSEAVNDTQMIAPQPHARIPDSPPPPFVSDDEDEATPPNRTGGDPSGSTPSSRASTSGSESASDAESIQETEERRAWEADIRNGLTFEVRLLREQQRRVARERSVLLKLRQSQDPETAMEAAEGEQVEPEVESAAASAKTAPPTEAESEAQPSESRVSPEPESAPEAEVQAVSEGVLQTEQSVAEEMTTERSYAEMVSETPDETQQVVSIVMPEEAPSAAPVAELTTIQTLTAPAMTGASASEVHSTVSQSSSAPSPLREQPTTNSAVPYQIVDDGRLMLANEPRLGLPPMSAASTMLSGSSLPGTRGRFSVRPSANASRRISGHRKISSDPRNPTLLPISQPVPGNKRIISGVRSSLVARRADGHLVRGHDSDSHLPLSRRPEDTLYVVSAPRPATHGTASSEDEATGSQPAVRLENDNAAKEMDEVDNDASSDHPAIDNDDEGAESDSSIEQWLAEAAAFDALRKREEEAAARLQDIRQPPVSDSDEFEDEEATIPGAFTHQPSFHRRQASATRKVPDPANLALMDQALPKAPPPLALGRSRGGAAYSDSSSESADTDDALDQYSSSDEDDAQHRAFVEAKETRDPDVFVGAHKSVHARSTSSAPNLTLGGDSEDDEDDDLKLAMEASRLEYLAKQMQDTSSLPPQVGEVEVSESQMTDAPSRSLSLKTKGKLPERIAVPSAAVQQPRARAGEFEEDSSSSRDVSDAEEAVNIAGQAATKPSVPIHLGSSDLAHRNSITSLPLSNVNTRRTSLDPLLQPLGYGPLPRNDVGNRLKGLFGQPLVAISPGQASSGLQANALPVTALVTQTSPATAEARRSLKTSREASTLSTQDPPPSPAAVAKPEVVTSPEPLTRTATPASARTVSLLRQSSSGDRSCAEAAKPSSSLAVPPEQRARDEALAQIAHLNASTARQDSLAALERLLTKTGRPTSMLPSHISHAELGRPQLAPNAVSSTESQSSTSGQQDTVTALDQPPTAPPAGTNNSLSRTGAINRTSRLPPTPPSTLSRAASIATDRPVSFVNPRSSAAPLPRGRLPAITDATRHFPPSASASAANPPPGVAPSWFSYIPSEERVKLPQPLEPHRMNSTRTPGSRVSAMIEKFETPREQGDGRSPSPTKRVDFSTSYRGGGTRSSSNRSNATGNDEGRDSDGAAEPAVFQRFSRNKETDGPSVNITQRRPPPPPPSLPRRPDTNPFEQSHSLGESPSAQPLSRPSSASMEALARQIDEATSAWTSASLQGSTTQSEGNSTSTPLRGVPSVSVSASYTIAPGSSGILRSPRTLAMDTLIGREYSDGATTPPMRPPKSPHITPEQIVARSSRTGLGASIAAGQAAAFARRNGSHSNCPSIDAGSTREMSASSRYHWARDSNGTDQNISQQTAISPRRLPTLPASVMMLPNQGLGIGVEQAAAMGRTSRSSSDTTNAVAGRSSDTLKDSRNVVIINSNLFRHVPFDSTTAIDIEFYNLCTSTRTFVRTNRF
uniref:Uncharacterized protein n=1 Tax=Melanopsichium pennsylvanicum 4 TaxID=1398559 RepID=A0A077R546_9BASI|nr:conserved hypothetical protein [Melanopsichium pennsylvanicum 4]